VVALLEQVDERQRELPSRRSEATFAEDALARVKSRRSSMIWKAIPRFIP